MDLLGWLARRAASLKRFRCVYKLCGSHGPLLLYLIQHHIRHSLAMDFSLAAQLYLLLHRLRLEHVDLDHVIRWVIHQAFAFKLLE